MLINEAGWVAFGFIIFCIIAWRYGAKPFVDVLEARANEVKEKLSEAENLRNEAKVASEGQPHCFSSCLYLHACAAALQAQAT